VTRRALGAALVVACIAGVAAAVVLLRPGSEPTASVEVERYAARPPGTVSFNADVAPMLHRECAPCHRPGEAAPFDLLTYEDAARRAKQIVEVTSRGVMPPWLAKPGSVRFEGERRLSADERGLIRQWVEEGLARGAESAAPAPPTFTSGWQLGQPDLVLEMDEAYPMLADGQDVFRNFVLPTGLRETRWVRALELRPGTPRAVHHANVLVDRTQRSRFHDARDAEPGFDGMLNSSAEYPSGQFIGWAPGKLTRPVPDEIAWRLDPGADVILQLHLQPTGKPEAVRATIGVYFAARPALREPFMLRLGPRTIDIPAGRRDYTIEDTFVLPVDVELLSVIPHAHYLAHEMLGVAVEPDGTRLELLDIPQWDFNWQDEYRLAEPLALPAGTTLTMRFTYDNSAGNPRNRSDPPLRVVFGPRTSNEMGDLWLQVLPRDGGDLRILEREFSRKEREAHIACYEKMIENDPHDVEVRYELGQMLYDMGQVDRAVERFEQVLAIEPDHVPTRAALGIALHARGQLDEAAANFRRALASMPELVEAHYNLAQTLRLQGRLDESLREYRVALELSPGLASAHHGLGEVLRAQGDPTAALAAYRRALELEPHYAQAHNNVGGILASRGDMAGAVEQFRAAVEDDPEYAQAHNNLGMALAARGSLDEAIVHFTRAVELRPDHEPSRLNLARALAMREQGRGVARTPRRRAVPSRRRGRPRGRRRDRA
jgi:tetratricopeptide (TPR) repeat protein